MVDKYRRNEQKEARERIREIGWKGIKVLEASRWPLFEYYTTNNNINNNIIKSI
jgi:hypothetical protein